MDFFSRLDALRDATNVLDHPFYTRWSRGELTQSELAVYAGEYRHAVVALADATASAARAAEPAMAAELEVHARQEREHISLWDEFAVAMGGDVDQAPTAETEECARTWAGDADRDLLTSLVALYAIEAGQPAISQTKREGLVAHYGVEASSPATSYFDLHAELDHEHAAHDRALIEQRLHGADLEALLAEADAVLQANWRLLDGVDRRNGHG